EAIDNSKLAGKTKDDIKTIAEVANQYITDEKLDINPEEKQEDLISKEIREIKKTLVYEGMTVTNTIVLPDDMKQAEGETKRLFLKFPEKFRANPIYINGNEVSYNTEEGIDVSGIEEDFVLSIDMSLNPKYLDHTFDIYSPIHWEWKVIQKGQTEVSAEDNADADEMV